MNALAIVPFPQLRAMRSEDLERVAEIERQCYEFPWSLPIFRDCLSAGYGCWVLEQAGEVIGYGIMSAGAGEAHVLNVCVAQDAQGQGHGRRLMKRLMDVARWHRAERIFLEVRPSNTRATGLYRRLGFAEIGRRTGYYPARQGREDALVMAFKL